MTQIVSNRTGRETIVKAEGKNTEIKIVADHAIAATIFESKRSVCSILDA